MDFEYDPKTKAYLETLETFMSQEVYPAESVAATQIRESDDPWFRPPVLDELKVSARAKGLWNLFLPDDEFGAGLTNLQYAPLAEISGRSVTLAPEAMNCSAPDTGNMEILAMFGTEEVKRDWLRPLLDGEIRSCFSMTEPDVASSDASNIAATLVADGDEFILNGRKWWSSGGMSAHCKMAIVMAVSDPSASRHRRHSMVLVPLDSPGVTIVRSTSVFGYDDGLHGGHAEIVYDNVRVPAAYVLGGPGEGFAIAQARLGPGRVHHAMRTIGMAERAFDLMCERVHRRSTFGRDLVEHGVVQDWIARARIWIEQVRLLVLKTAWLLDTVGNKAASVEISAIKIAAPQMATWVIDRAIQAHGGLGVSQDTPLAAMYGLARILRIADGPDEVHMMALARREARRFAPTS